MDASEVSMMRHIDACGAVSALTLPAGFATTSGTHNHKHDDDWDCRYSLAGKRKECRVCDGKLKGADLLTK